MLPCSSTHLCWVLHMWVLAARSASVKAARHADRHSDCMSSQCPLQRSSPCPGAHHSAAQAGCTKQYQRRCRSYRRASNGAQTCESPSWRHCWHTQQAVASDRTGSSDRMCSSSSSGSSAWMGASACGALPTSFLTPLPPDGHAFGTCAMLTPRQLGTHADLLRSSVARRPHSRPVQRQPRPPGGKVQAAWRGVWVCCSRLAARCASVNWARADSDGRHSAFNHTLLSVTRYGCTTQLQLHVRSPKPSSEHVCHRRRCRTVSALARRALVKAVLNVCWRPSHVQQTV